MSPVLHRRLARAARARAVTAAAILVGLAVVSAACSGPSKSDLTDPVEILQKGAASLAALKTVHVRGTIDGDVPLSIGGLGGGAPLSLDGTTLEGDVDVAGAALSFEVVATALLNMKVNLVVVDGITYLKAPIITGQKWVRQAAGSGIGLDPGALLEGLSTFLARPELKPEKLPDARCAGTDCYVVRFTVPAAEVRAALGSLGSAIPGLSGDAVGDVTVTVGVRKDDLRLATLGLDVPAGGKKPLSIRIELSAYDAPVTITAPPADQVVDRPGG
jgi:hypothetical protein